MSYFQCKCCGATSTHEVRSPNFLVPEGHPLYAPVLSRLCTYCGAEEYFLPAVDGLVLIRLGTDGKVALIIADYLGRPMLAQTLSRTRALNLSRALSKFVRATKPKKVRKR